MKTTLLRRWMPFIFVIGITMVQAQEVDLDKLMEQETKAQKSEPTEFAIPIFKTTRVSNGHSVETLPSQILDIKIQHRFGFLNGGWNEFFGLDNATIRLGADYGVTNRLMIGVGRATYEKQLDAFAKYKILEQSSGKKNKPLSLAVLASVMLQTMPTPDGLSYKPHFSDRLYYAGQLLVARRFGDAFSLQLMPTIVHYNIVPTASQSNDFLALGAATSIKITKQTSLVIEYYYNIPGFRLETSKNVLSVGLDIETGGHVFQLFFTNGSGNAERPFITESPDDFFKGDIRFGFNIGRVFQVGRKGK